jgi:glutamine cyclotransferase
LNTCWKLNSQNNPKLEIARIPIQVFYGTLETVPTMNRRHYLKTSVILGGSLLFSRGAIAQDNPRPEVVSKIAAPRDSARGLTFDGDSLWVGLQEDEQDNIFEIDTNGEINQSFSVEGDDIQPRIYALAAIDDSLFAFGNEFILHKSREVTLYDLTKDGERNMRYEMGYKWGYDSGLASDSEHLYLNQEQEDIIRVYDTNINQQRSVPLSGGFYGLCYDGENLWGTQEERLVKFSTEGEVLQEFDYPGDHGYGLAHDGEYLYMIDNSSTQILQLDTDVDTPNPSASFQISSDTPVTNEDIEFDASQSSHPNNSITRYKWDFDDDGTIEEETDSAIITHQYSQPGEKTIGLTVVDENGQSDTITKQISVRESSSDEESSLSSQTYSGGERSAEEQTESTSNSQVEGIVIGAGGTLVSLLGIGYVVKKFRN